MPKRFHLNDHTIEIRRQTQKLELHYVSPYLTLGVKGLKDWSAIKSWIGHSTRVLGL